MGNNSSSIEALRAEVAARIQQEEKTALNALLPLVEPVPEGARFDPCYSKKNRELYYSNQGNAGTCSRHALAKAICREISTRTKDKLVVSIESLVGVLIQVVKGEGAAKGAHPIAWNGVSVIVHGCDNNLYEATVGVQKAEFNRECCFNIVCGDLRLLLPREYGSRKEPALHALFCSSFIDNKKVVLQNSWGNLHKQITMDIDYYKSLDKYVIAYNVEVVKFTKCSADTQEDVVIKAAEDAKWSNLEQVGCVHSCWVHEIQDDDDRSHFASM
eukprot:TRINITY_DN9333_c0_g1_i2.p1 TRINITY_DN9333_c0_g1~~TRINITY_DN9333_c0_g1_i2.p1  ORF type:complete len:272 (-),score=62.94 TRINITY_DN9333_c0_g1_i2:167-982(-)